MKLIAQAVKQLARVLPEFVESEHFNGWTTAYIILFSDSIS